MIEGLDFNAILDEEQENSLFGEPTEETTEEHNDGEQEDANKNKNTTAEVDPDSMFEESPESVGGEDNKDNEEDTTPSEKDGTSPDFFSSIANAFAEEGIFPDLDPKEIESIKTAADLRSAIDKQMRAGLDEQQRRVAEALDNDVEPDQIRQYESIISYLDSITEADITSEGDEGDTLRKKLLFQDYTNRGFSRERAEKMVNKAFEQGTDVEDAKEALEGNKTYFKKSYQDVLASAKAEKEKEEQENKDKAARIKKTILEGDISKFFGDVEIDKGTRQAAYDAVTKPIYKDPKTGQTYTAVQKMELDNSEDFFVKLGLVYALTDGLKSIDGLVKKKVKKEVKRGFSELESKINNTSRDSRGNLRFTSGVDDAESILGKGVKLDL